MRRSELKPNPLFLAAALLTLAGSASASSDAAWQEHDRAVIEQCQQASQFPDAAPAGDPVLFDDEAGMTALLIQGHYPQKQMNGQAGQELCLFLRSSQEVFIADADKLAIGSDALPSTPTDAISDDAESKESDQPPSAPSGDTP
ncbi:MULTISPECIES: hypothetical protein [Salinicola]|uniref:Uncharacterized protein n=1 Tax=Salinicola socius TaxID=404433 RepID=A0A1Q8SUU4_9GAMM|nr:MULTISPECIES: hypothetical protein [Salinicola]OLO05176.1 hypothetical protein BTW07_06110 [Salinicola socius]